MSPINSCDLQCSGNDAWMLISRLKDQTWQKSFLILKLVELEESLNAK